MIKLIFAPSFVKDAKRLSKKYRTLCEDIAVLKKELLQNPNMGIPLGKHISKIRLAIRAKGKGKSGGGRVIAYHEVFVSIKQHTIYLIALYDKSESDAISDKQIVELLKQNGLD